MRVDVDLGRCICIHSLSQMIDITLQVLLYQRQIIPEPVSLLLHRDADGAKAEKFRAIYNDVMRVIRRSFCHRNSECLREFVIIIGSSPYLPKEIYRIPVSICLKHLNLCQSDRRRRSHRKSDTNLSYNSAMRDVSGSMSGNEIDDQVTSSSNGSSLSGCGDHCTSLSPREKRQIFSSLALSKTVQNLLNNSVLTANDKVFFFMSSKADCNSTLFDVDGLEEDDSFELPCEEMRKRRNIRELFVHVKSTACPLEFGTPNSSVLSNVSSTRNRISPRLNHSNVSVLSNNFNSNTYNSGHVSEDTIDEKEDNVWLRVLQYFTRLS